jgi:putative membrane protein
MLAWIRTCLALIGLGFVVARFGLFVRALDRQTGTGGSAPQASTFVGVALVLVGALIAALSVYRFHMIGRSIEAGRFELDVSVELITAAATILAGVVLAA